MIPVYAAQRVRALDRAVIEQVGVPGRQLMELAGRDAAKAIHTRWPDARTGVFCGPGNNGGDGYVVARWLAHWGHDVRVWWPITSGGLVPCCTTLATMLSCNSGSHHW